MRLVSILLLALPVRVATEHIVSGCIDSANGALGASERACPEPRDVSSRCNSDDDVDFSANLMCCVCGGGSETRGPPSSGVSLTAGTSSEAVTRDGLAQPPSTPSLWLPSPGTGMERARDLLPRRCPRCNGCPDDASGVVTKNRDEDGACCECPAAPGAVADDRESQMSRRLTGDCSNTAYGAKDKYGSGCNFYNNNPSWCGGGDDDSDFSSDEMCCGCGGGDTAGCSNLDNGATDPYGDGCPIYFQNPDWCGSFDDSDFSSDEMCCGCGGGTAPTPVPTSAPTSTPLPSPVPTSSLLPTASPVPTPVSPVPTPSPTPKPSYSCSDLDEGATDPYGDTCASHYDASPVDCGSSSADDSDFSSNEMCCACGGGSTFSLVPTPAPTPLPSHPPTPRPSAPPTSAPSPLPTPAPTPTTVVTIAPEIDKLSLVATKPANVSNLETSIFYLVNLNGETLSGTTRLLHTSLPDKDAWSVSPSAFAIAPGNYKQVIVSIKSVGLEPRPYTNSTILFTAWTDNSLPVNQSLGVSVTIRTSIDCDQTVVNVQGRPAHNTRWKGITIIPFDSDGYRIDSEPEENVGAVLSFGNQSKKCDVKWSASDAHYSTSCVVSGTSRAGRWTLTALLNDVAFFTTAVHVKCEEGYFENLDYICEACPLPGTECLAGSTLLNLPVIPGFWRSGEVWSWKC